MCLCSQKTSEPRLEKNDPTCLDFHFRFLPRLEDLSHVLLYSLSDHSVVVFPLLRYFGSTPGRGINGAQSFVVHA